MQADPREPSREVSAFTRLELLVVHIVEIATGQITRFALEPAITESSTSRGWIGVQPSGVSADGRYVALTAFPPEPADATSHMQVYLLDTQEGTRQLLSQGVDGNLANGHPMLPSLSADVTRVFFVSWATNLVPEDDNGVSDAFVHTVATGERRILRADPVASSAPALFDSVLSPNGEYAYVRFTETNTAVARLVRLATGVISAPFPNTAGWAPSFSRDGLYVAIHSTPTGHPLANRIEIHDPAAWLDGGGNATPALWTSDAPALSPSLSGDGKRVAYIDTSLAYTNELVVVDWTQNQTLFSRPVNRTSLVATGAPVLSADGCHLVWLSPDSRLGTTNQVWHADVETGTVTRVSVAPDGVTEANENSKYPAVSVDGRYVAFASTASNLVPFDANGVKDVFLRDLQTGQTLLLSRTPAGASGDGWSSQPFFGADGRCLFFLSHAPDLSPGDYNQAVDLFKVEIVADSALLVVLQRNLATGETRLLWNAQAGKTYGVEFTDNLATGWSRLPGEFTTEAQVDVNPAAGHRRFFRLLELPTRQRASPSLESFTRAIP